MDKFHRRRKQGKLISVLRKAEALVDDAAFVICSLNVDELEERTRILLDFIERIDVVKAKIIELYSPSFDLSSWNYPTTNVMGFIDLQLENLKSILKYKITSIPSIKHGFVVLQEELQWLRPFLKDIKQLQNENDEVNKLWTRIANMAYQATDAINSFCDMRHCLWYVITCISNVTEEIRHIKSEVLKTQLQRTLNIGLQQTLNIQDVNTEMSSELMLPVPANPSDDEVIVGFEDETQTIIDRLTKGSRGLEIVPIVGMAGLGKTTLVKNVYKNPSVKYHFHKCAWSTVSQSYQTKELLMNILSAVSGPSFDVSKMTNEELEDRLRKCLKGRRYLIFLDDIWDIKAWYELKQSLPDDKNGSRIMFTSRNHDIALQAKPNCIPYSLNPMSDKESWMLLQQKLFNKHGCPPTFLEVGIQVAKECKGLPLAIVVVAGLLATKVGSLDWWKQIAKSLASLVAREGCMDILGLSYEDLPESLKPCFLYFGLFKEDQEIKVQKLIRLWISEGFVQYSGMESLENIAEEYLMHLVNRSLVTVSSRSSTGGIKRCRIHDLLREFCIVRGEKENFFKVISQDGVSNCPPGSMYKHYRLCIQTGMDSFLDSNPTGPCVHSLMFCPSLRNYHDVGHFGFSEFECLQVLDMEDYALGYYHLLILTSLVLLRYLAICWFFDKFPTSIVQLVNLETISIRTYYDGWIEFPQNIWTSMRKLRHLHMTPCRARISSSQHHELGQSSGLQDLRTFSELIIFGRDQPETLFRRMPRVRNLKFQLSRGAQFPMLNFLSELESLHVKCFTIVRTYPCATDFPLTLKKLTLQYFELPWSAISPIANLPNLKVLKVMNDAFVGERWDVRDGEFTKLKFLKLYRMKIVQWNSSNCSFPSLEQLVVEECPFLAEIPPRFGDILTLKTISVQFCGSGVNNSARRIQEEQLNLGNEDLKLRITNI